MAKATPGFKLYLYQLLSRELGVGKQTLLPQVEEVLAADDIIPEDLECATIQELVEACPDFLKLTIFKKGRAYATVLRNEEWDQMLAMPEEKPAAGAKRPAAGGPKAWKKKKGGRKVLKPVKPGKQRRDREAAEARAAAELAAAEEARAAEELAAAKEAEEQTAFEAEVPSEPAGPVEAEETAADADASEGAAPTITAPTLAEVLAQARAAEDAVAEAAETIGAEDEEPEVTSVVEPTPQPSSEVAQPADVAPAPAMDIQAEETAALVVEEPKAPVAPEPAPISLTITYDPYEDMERELERQRIEAEAGEAAFEPRPKPTPATRPTTGGIPLDDLPQDLASELACKDAQLRMLYQLLPYEVEPMAVLDEDWRVARSTAELSGTRNRVTFPLRYLHEDGTPITVTLRKTARSAFGKRWNLALVDGDDGTGSSHAAVGFEGLPAADEGAWSDLSTSSVDLAVSPLRELAQKMVIGTWDSFLGSLAATVAPERWNYPGEGVGKASRYGILREYVCCTYHRARCQERIARSADGSFAAFNTGLLTAFGEDVYACMTARAGDIPWQFAGFATAGSGELGGRLAGTISPLPEPPSYLSSLDCVIPLQDRMVILDLEAILTRQLGRLPRAFLADLVEGNASASALLDEGATLTDEGLAQLARAIKQDGGSHRRMRRTLDDAIEQAMRSVRASYRLAAPVYDPAENRTKLLVPLCLVEDGKADCALVLDLQPSGAYRAATVLPLPRAYACARVISREQPSWLDPRRVL